MAKAASHRRVRPSAPPPGANSLVGKFGRVSKNYASTGKSDKKVLAVCLPNSKTFGPVTVTCLNDASDEENQAPITHTLVKSAPVSHSKKRKADSAEDDAATASTAVSRTIKRSRVLSQVPANISLDSTLTAPRAKCASSAKKDDLTTSKKANRSKKPIPQAFAPKTANEKNTRQQLPAELLELLSLQRAILRTVVLQIAHQNSSSPIDINSISPHVSLSWGKRQVTTDDIRRCIAIQDLGSDDHALRSPFIVTDYGRGKLFLEIVNVDDVRPIDETKLCKQFESNLHAMCAERAVDEMSDLDISFESLSFTDLPKSDITARHSHLVGHQNPLLAKGQRALTELRQGMAMKQQEREAKTNTLESPALKTLGGKMSLLDRLRAKEAAKAQMELPSGPELARQRALQRASDVASIIGMLASSSNPMGVPVLSYTMAILQQKLQDSLRVPMPAEEGIDTVKLIANEVAPEWLRVVKLAGKEHVVIQTRSKPYDSEITARVNKLVA